MVPFPCLHIAECPQWFTRNRANPLRAHITIFRRSRDDTQGQARHDTGGDPICNFQIIVPGFGTFAGAFMVQSAEYGGEQEDGVTYSLSLASSGPVTFTALPAS